MSGPGFQVLCILCFQPRPTCICEYFHAPSPMALFPGMPQLYSLRPRPGGIDHSRPNPFGEPMPAEPVPQMRVVGTTMVEIPARAKPQEEKPDES